MTDAKKEPAPVFEFEGGRKMYPPYILNCCQEYEQKVSMGDPDVLPEMQRLTIMQAYFAGFSRAASFVDMLYSDPNKDVIEKRTLVLEAIKSELADYSRLNREFAAKSGLPIASVKNG